MQMMKCKLNIFLFTVVALLTLTSSGDSQIRRTTYHPTLKGDVLKYHVTKADGTHVADYEMLVEDSYRKDGHIWQANAFRVFRPDGKPFFSGENLFHMDFNQTVDGKTSVAMDEIFKALKVQDFLPNGDASNIPETMEVGDILPDTIIDAKTGIVNATLKTTNRKVLDHKNISCPAGTFECWLVHEECQTKTPVGTFIVISDTWYTPGIGSVKQTTFNSKGEIKYIEELTECNYMK